MLADTIQSFGNQCWIESSPFLTSTHLHVIPGPLNLDQIHHETTAFHPPYVNSKCCSSKFADQSSTVEIEPEQRFYIKLAIYNQSKQPQTLPRGVVATITPMTDVHRADLFVAASDTELERLNLNRLSESTRMYLCCPAHRFVELLMSNTVLRPVMLNLNTPHHIHTLLLKTGNSQNVGTKHFGTVNISLGCPLLTGKKENRTRSTSGPSSRLGLP